VTGEWRTLYREELENCSRLDYYAESSGYFLPAFLTPNIGPIGCPETPARNYNYSPLTLKMVPDRLSRNVGEKLPLFALDS